MAKRAQGPRVWLALALLAAALAPLGAVPAQAAPGKPDLVVASLAMDPPSPGDGDVVVFVAMVANDGNASENRTFRVTFLVGNVTLGKANVSGLGAGNATRVVSPPWQADAGARNATAIVDAEKAIAESNETNNARVEGLSVGDHVPAPDLTLGDATVTPASPQPDEETRVVLNVRNEGDAPANASKLGFFVDGKLAETADVPPLGPGETYRRGFSWWYARGEHTVRVVADLAGEVAESDEHDNETRLVLDVGTPRPDLVVASLSVEPPDPVPGETARVVAVVENRGDARANASEAALELGGEELATPRVEALGPGGRATVEASVPWPPGAQVVRAMADAAKDVQEKDEANNARSLTVRASTAKPDLTVGSLEVRPTLPAGGDRVELQATVRNQGRAPSPPSALELRLDGAVLARVDVPALGPGEQHQAAWPWDAVEGWHDVQARADAAGQVAEGSEANNALASRFVVAAPGAVRSDLGIALVQAEPAMPPPGQEVAFAAQVVAQGAMAQQAFQVTFTLDGQPLDTQQGSAPSGTATVRARPWQATQGTHVLRAAVQAVGGGPDADPGNDAYDLTFAVGLPATPAQGLPDVVVVAVGPDPLGPEGSATVPVVATLRNDGPAPAGRFSVELAVDGERLGTIGVTELAAGATMNVTWLEWNATPGLHRFEAWADPVGLLAEAERGNNRLEAQAIVGPTQEAAAPKALPGPGALAALLGLALALALAGRRPPRRRREGS